MELKINGLQLPGQISFNYEELKAELLQRVSVYESMVYTEDQVMAAKKDRASLNGLKKALNDERIRQEKEFMKPFQEFKAQVADLCSIIDKASGTVDKQVKEFEEQKKQDKLTQIQDYFECHPTIEGFQELLLSQIFEEKWLNASVRMKSIQEAIDSKMGKIMDDLDVVRSLPSYAFEAEQVYKLTLDLGKAVSEAHRLQAQAEAKAAWEASQAKRNEEVAVAKNESTTVDAEDFPAKLEPCRQWIGFQALLSVDEASSLGRYFENNGIQYKKI